MTIFARIRKSLNREVYIFFIGVFTIGIGFAFTIPFGYGHDESVHAFKASSIGSGNLQLTKIGPWTTPRGTPINVYGGPTPQTLVALEQFTSDIRLSSPCDVNQCMKPSDEDKNTLTKLASKPLRSDEITTDFWGANSYTFIGYIPSASGFTLSYLLDLSVGSSIYLARLFNLLACAFIAAAAFTLLSHSRFRWVLFSIGLLPPVIISFASIGTDGLLISLSLLLGASTHYVITQPKTNRKTAILIGVGAAALIPLIKLPYVLLSIAFLLILPKFIKHNKLLKLGLLLLFLVPGLIWSIYSSDATRTQYLSVNAGTTEPNTKEQLLYIAHHPLQTATIFTKSLFGNTLTSIDRPTHQPGMQLPTDVMTVSFVLLAISTLYASHTPRHKKEALIMLVASMGIVIGISLAMYLTYNPVGATTLEGVQGRYMIPLYVFIALALSILLQIHLSKITPSLKYLFISISLGMPLVCLLWYGFIVY